MYNGNVAVIQLGQMGLLTDVPPSEVPRGALIRAQNISFETGLITKAPGSLRYNDTVLPAGIVALFDWWPDTVTQRLIVACADGNIYRDIGDKTFSSATAIATGFGTLTPKCIFVEGGQETLAREKKLFFYSGSSQLKVLNADESTFADVEFPASDWTTPNYPKFGFIHRNRLWSFLGQRAYASDTGNHENNTSNNLTQSIFPGEGGDITGGHVFKGRAFVFKEGGFVYYLDDTDTDSSNWVWRRLGSNFGLSSPNGIIEITNDMLAMSESGALVSYNAVNALGDVESGDVFRLMQIQDYVRNNTSLSGLDVLHAIYYEAKKQAFFTFRTSYQTNNDTLLHIDFNREQPRAAFWDKDSADCLGLRKDINKVRRPIYGASDGYVYLMDQEDRLVGGSAYTGEFKIGHTDFRFLDEKAASKNKNFDFLDIEFKPMGLWNLAVDVYIDGKFSETINFMMDVRDDGLDTFTLDTDALGREETQTIRKPLHGSGRRISFHCQQSGSNQNFSVASFSIGFRMSAEQATRV